MMLFTNRILVNLVKYYAQNAAKWNTAYRRLK